MNKQGMIYTYTEEGLFLTSLDSNCVVCLQPYNFIFLILYSQTHLSSYSPLQLFVLFKVFLFPKFHKHFLNFLPIFFYHFAFYTYIFCCVECFCTRFEVFICFLPEMANYIKIIYYISHIFTYQIQIPPLLYIKVDNTIYCVMFMKIQNKIMFYMLEGKIWNKTHQIVNSVYLRGKGLWEVKRR